MKKVVALVFLFVVIFSCKQKEKHVEKPESSEGIFVKLENAVLSSGILFRLDSLPSKYIKQHIN